MEPEIKWDFRNKCFTINGRAVSGVHPTIHSLFYPNYSFLQARARAQHNVPAGQRHRYYGIRAGTSFDNTIEKSVALFVRTGTRPDHSRITGLLKGFWIMCEKKGWVPTASQVTVGCATLRVATRIDVVCKDTSGNVVLLEIKRGYSYCAEASHMMNAPFTDRNNCPKNQFQLQLLLNRELYRRTYQQRVIGGCYVCRFEEDQVNIYPLEAWAVSRVEPFLRCIEQRNLSL